MIGKEDHYFSNSFLAERQHEPEWVIMVMHKGVI